MINVVTGGAGFIGSYLVDALLQMKEDVRVIDNLSSKNNEFLKKHEDNSRFSFHKIDLLNDDFSDILKNADSVWHMAANPDVKIGASDTKLHLEQGMTVTYNVLEAMHKNKVKEILFASSSTVYGEAETPTPENYGPLEPISLYGASKLSCEAMISAYSHVSGIKGSIFRFANVIGERSNHGVLFDFFNKLKNNPNELEILGNGNQKKSYIHITDCINAMLFIKQNTKDRINIYNIGSEDWVTVKRIAEIVSESMQLNPKFKYTGGDRGWKGDVPFMLLSINKLKSLGWKPKLSSEESVKETAKKISVL